MKNLILTLILVSIFASCDKKIENSNNNVPSEEEIARTQDSIRKVKQDSIDAVNKKIAEEIIERMTIDASSAIDKFTREYMVLVSPVSGENPRYEILNEESEFIPETGTIKFVFISRWEGVAKYLDNKIETHESKGRITYYGDGQVRYEELEQNDVLKTAIEASNAMAKLKSLSDSFDGNN